MSLLPRLVRRFLSSKPILTVTRTVIAFEKITGLTSTTYQYSAGSQTTTHVLNQKTGDVQSSRVLNADNITHRISDTEYNALLKSVNSLPKNVKH